MIELLFYAKIYILIITLQIFIGVIFSVLHYTENKKQRSYWVNRHNSEDIDKELNKKLEDSLYKNLFSEINMLKEKIDAKNKND